MCMYFEQILTLNGLILGTVLQWPLLSNSQKNLLVMIRRPVGTICFMLRSLCTASCDMDYVKQNTNASPSYMCAKVSSNEEHDELSSMASDLNVNKVELAEKILRHSIKESEGKSGSGIDGAFLRTSPCANWSVAEGFACSNAGSASCTSCGLVQYCSSECKEEHLGEHENCCQFSTSRKPLVKKPIDTQSKKVLLKADSDFLWGNVPAYSILGRGFKAKHIAHDMSLCFCASGDLRNVIETVCQLPYDSKGHVTVYINDRNPIIMARNFLMLKLLQVYAYDALDAIIALWYSAAMTQSQSIVIDGVVIDMLRSTVSQGKAGESYWIHFKPLSSSTLSIDDGSKIWPILARMSACKYSLQDVLSIRADKIRSGLKFDCKMACLRSSHQVAWKAFRETGLLLPFGACNTHHCAPNKFFVHPSGKWLLHADANPFSGWDIRSVIATGLAQELPASDVFGCLFFHIRRKLLNFLQKLEMCEIHFKLSCKDASQLAAELASQNVRLHCIDTSNLADLNYGGICRVLHDWGPLLNRASNFAATLITYFMNWLYMDGAASHEQITLSKLTWNDVHSVVASMNTRSPPCSEKLKELLAIGNSYGNLSILDYFHDFTPMFEEYLLATHAEMEAKKVGLARRKKHLIVPRRISTDVEDCNGIPGMTASYDECYYDCMVGDLTFTEQFVEWGLS